jgi:membrane protein YqaA with SNARE-associated domain
LSEFSPTDDRSRYRRLAIAATGVALGAAGLVAWLMPTYRPLVYYFLYAVPAHLLVSVLANEPALFAAAKEAAPAAVAIAGTLGCVVAIILDYALIGWFVNRRLIRTEIDDSKGFRVAQRFFGKAPMVLIVLSALLPVPFFPVKILGIIRDYPLPRFILGILIGRLPRFYLLALAGQKVQAPGSALASAGATLALIGMWGLWRTVKRNRARK